MKILFIRHGESTDDINDQYGGWGDFHLTAKGKEQIKKRIPVIKKTGLKFERIYTSPLLRAKESAKILSENLNVPYEVYELVKERNRYGVLSGMRKNVATKKFPEVVNAFQKDKFVLASEREKDLIKRIHYALEKLPKDCENIIVVTHGNFLRFMTREVFNDEISQFGDGGFILTSFGVGKAKILKKFLL